MIFRVHNLVPLFLCLFQRNYIRSSYCYFQLAFRIVGVLLILFYIFIFSYNDKSCFNNIYKFLIYIKIGINYIWLQNRKSSLLPTIKLQFNFFIFTMYSCKDIQKNHSHVIKPPTQYINRHLFCSAFNL